MCAPLLLLAALLLAPQDAAVQLGYRPSGAYKIFERCLAALIRGLVATGFMKEQSCEEQ